MSKKIVYSNVANALKSSASDHVLGVSADIYDESLDKYQSEINSELKEKTDLINKTSKTFDGTATKANQLTTSRKFSLKSGVISDKTDFNGSDNVELNVTKIYESYLTWGNTNLTGNMTPIDCATDGEYSANRLSFMPANNIEIEYSRDGGENWYTYPDFSQTHPGTEDIPVVDEIVPVPDTTKTSLVTSGLTSTIYLGARAKNQSASDQLRVTINAKNSFYGSIKKLLLYITRTTVRGMYCQLSCSTNGNTETFTNLGGEYLVSGWPGWNSIPISNVMGGTNADYINKLRLTFRIEGPTSTTNVGRTDSNAINKIRLIAPILYSTSNGSLASNGHLYTWDANKNVTFPAHLSTNTLNCKSSATFDSYTHLKNEISVYANNINRWITFRNTNDLNNSWRLGFWNSETTDNEKKWFLLQGADETGTYLTAIKFGLKSKDAHFQGNIIPYTNKSKNLGKSDLQWKNIYAENFFENGVKLLNKYIDNLTVRTKNTVLAAPNNIDGIASFRLLTMNDMPQDLQNIGAVVEGTIGRIDELEDEFATLQENIITESTDITDSSEGLTQGKAVYNLVNNSLGSLEERLSESFENQISDITPTLISTSGSINNNGFVSMNIFPNTYYAFNEPVVDINVTLQPQGDLLPKYMFEFTMKDTDDYGEFGDLTITPSVKWENSTAPSIHQPNKTFQVTIINGLASFKVFS